MGLLSRIRTVGPPLRGVLHAAGVLTNGALLRQDVATFQKVLAPKVEGAALLDRLTRSDPLHWLILFFSIAAILRRRASQPCRRQCLSRSACVAAKGVGIAGRQHQLGRLERGRLCSRPLRPAQRTRSWLPYAIAGHHGPPAHPAKRSEAARCAADRMAAVPRPDRCDDACGAIVPRWTGCRCCGSADRAEMRPTRDFWHELEEAPRHRRRP